ncbi:myb-like protein X [Patella vulgata]|uniref:myb-like protein X n=1 Tax=Patella vulgata TaxID=6465 RepID=UPI00217FFB33|nr:myb-like protein X [Patella vulgata]
MTSTQQMNMFMKISVLFCVLYTVVAAPTNPVQDVKTAQESEIGNQLLIQPKELTEPQTSNDDEDDDGDQGETPEIDIQSVLKQFFRRLKNHPEIVQELIEREEKKLMEREDLKDMKLMAETEDNTTPVIKQGHQTEKELDKNEETESSSETEYDPRSSDVTGTVPESMFSNINNVIPAFPYDRNPENGQPGKEDIQKIAEAQEKYSEANPFLNTLPLFNRLPNPNKENSNHDDVQESHNNIVEGVGSGPVGSNDNLPNPSNHDDQSVTKTKYDIKEIKHVPIEEELVSEVPPSELAEKKELRDEARDVLQQTAEQALKTEKYQKSLLQESLLQKAGSKRNPDSKEHPYNYIYYYYDYDQDLKPEEFGSHESNDDIGESREFGSHESNDVSESREFGSHESNDVSESSELNESNEDSESSEENEDHSSPEEEDVQDEDHISEETDDKHDKHSHEMNSQEEELQQLVKQVKQPRPQAKTQHM